MHSQQINTLVQGRLSRTVVNLFKVIIHPTVDLSPGHASIAIHQSFSLHYQVPCMNTASKEPTQYDEKVISMPQCICNSIVPTLLL